jgi:hypothetical protein
MIIFLLFGGVAVDSSNAWRMRAELQATADAAAHAGVIELIDGAEAARTAAIGMALKNMDYSQNGDVLVQSDVLVGKWNGATFEELADSDVFEINAAGEPVLVANAVLARTRRDQINANQVPAYFLRLMGMQGWDVNALAIAQRYFPECLEGSAIVAAKIVDVQSNNKFHPGICVHAQDYVNVNGGGGPSKDEFGNVWETGVHVTMPSLDKFYDKYGAIGNQQEHLDTHNGGLEPSLGEEWFYPKIVDSIGSFLTNYTTATDESVKTWPDYIAKTVTNPDGTTTALSGSELIKNIKANEWDIANYEEGFIYNVDCGGVNKLFKLGVTDTTAPLQNVVVVANCNIKIGSKGLVKNAVIGSTAGDNGAKTDNSIIDIGAGTTLGDSTNCSNPGSVKLLSTASVSGPANTNYKGVQILAKGNVHIAAQADAKVEINVQAGGNIDFTSGNEFGEVCLVSDDDLLRVSYYRLVL